MSDDEIELIEMLAETGRARIKAERERADLVKLLAEAVDLLTGGTYEPGDWNDRRKAFVAIARITGKPSSEVKP